MEQITYLNQLLYIPKLPNLQISAFGQVKNSYIILITVLILCTLNYFEYCYSLTILIFGLLLPFWCLHLNISIQNYFPFMAILLWIRLFFFSLQSLDAILIVCLWHPNIKLGNQLTDQISKFINKQNSLKTQLLKVKKML